MREYSARLIFLCASTLATTRVLLNSTSPRFPNGLANSSGALGHYLMDHHFVVGASGAIEGLLDRYYQGNVRTASTSPGSGTSVTTPRAAVNTCGGSAIRRRESPGMGARRGRARLRGGAETQAARSGPVVHGSDRVRRVPAPRRQPSAAGQGDDEFGVPLLRIQCTWGENELAMRKDMAASAAEMLQAAGCKEVRTRDAYKEGGLGRSPGSGSTRWVPPGWGAILTPRS